MKLIKSISLLLIIISISCTNTNKEKVRVDFSESDIPDQTRINNETKPVYIAIASMTSPKETYIYYNDLIQYISDKINHPILIKQKKTYEEVNTLLENSEVDFAFICSGAFVDEYQKGEIKLLVAPVIDSSSTYNAYIITQKDSKIEKFEDFQNNSFAFNDPLSNTGRLYPLKKLYSLNKTEEDFFMKTIYTYGHDISIQMVNHGIIDGSSVHGLIFDYLATHQPDKVENLKIIEKSEAFGIPPVVTPRSLSIDKFKEYQDIFLNLHNDSIGRSIIEKLNIDKFQQVTDTVYRSVFELKEYIDNAAKK